MKSPSWLEILVEDGPAKEDLRRFLTEPDFSRSPMGSVCAETVRKDISGNPKARVYIWLTHSDPPRVMYSYGAGCNHGTAIEMPVSVEAGLLELEDDRGESGFAKHVTREILLPLMKAA